MPKWVVVVVVVGMETPNDYADKIGSTEWKFSRADESNSKTNTNAQVYVSDMDVDLGAEYGFIMTPVASVNQPFKGPVCFKSEIYQSEPRFTVPVDVIREHSILPGHAVNFHVFNLSDEQMTISSKPAEGDEKEPQIEEARSLLSQANEILKEITDE